MLSFEEREERKNQIGASEIYKLFNFDNQEAQDLWELKLGIQSYEQMDNNAITAGNLLEEDCLKYFESSNNCELIYNERLEHKLIKGFVVSLDARIKDTSIPVENKVINEKTWEKWISKKSFNAVYDGIKLNIPKSYYCQLQAQIAVLDTEEGIFNVNTLTDDEQLDPINVVLTDLHNKQIKITKDNVTIRELENRVSYMLECIKYKKRPNELDFLETKVF